MSKKLPILFGSEMVRALLDGRKTQTRRVISPNKRFPHHNICRPDKAFFDHQVWFHGEYESVGVMVDAPYSVGDLLWVRETFWIAEHYSYGSTPGGCEIPAPPLAYRRGDPVFYAADGNPPNVGNRTYGPEGLRNGAFAAPDPYAIWIQNPSIHMPRWASRVTLRVTNICAQRLQDISEDDARAEGVKGESFGRHMLWSGRGSERPTLSSARQAFLDHIWTDLYGEHETKSVCANPWVWVYKFDVIRANVDEVAA
ncbi:hypothetical protein IFJ82_09790 [Novacetimonas hansenii]|uniref:hypothetical protein n=1 Tax=Novacetimonas hansenii TaxID=436 RepID=UPI00177C3569|nr:hypothetical protein [Novacetimonas hansenii]QOF94242.1 hypothetical protein IFJ82_09790 [Novacetimonas hansenii]